MPVKLMPEYSAELPLWNHDWEDLRLAPDLLDDLADWQATFDAEFDHVHGWSDETVKREWAVCADALVTRLRAALPPEVQLDVDLWPLDGR